MSGSFRSEGSVSERERRGREGGLAGPGGGGEGGLAGPGVRDGMMGFGMGWKGDSMVGRWGWENE